MNKYLFKPNNYWVTRRDSQDSELGGIYRRMEIYSGPYPTREAADAEAMRLRTELNKQLHNEAIDKSLRRPLLTVTFWAMSDAEIEEGRRRGISITPASGGIIMPKAVETAMNKMLTRFAEKYGKKFPQERLNELRNEMTETFFETLALKGQPEVAAEEAFNYVGNKLWFFGEG